MEELAIIEKVKGGRTEAFEHLVRKYQDRLFNACWRICGHLDDARDLTQEAFLKAFENMASFRQESGFYTWLFRIAMNLALSQRRKERTRRMVSLDQQTQTGGSQAEALALRAHREASSNSIDPVGDAERQGMIAHALMALDEEHRAVIVLRDIEGFDYHEISGILDIPTGTVKSRLHRARMALREAIRPRLAGDD